MAIVSVEDGDRNRNGMKREELSGNISERKKLPSIEAAMIDDYLSFLTVGFLYAS